MTKYRLLISLFLSIIFSALHANAQAPAPASPASQPTTQAVVAASAPAPAVFMLAAQEPTGDRGGDRGLLMRELMRQAVLIAARDELGLPTRDQALREPFATPVTPRLAPVGIETGPYGWEYYRASLTQNVAGKIGRLRLPDVPYLQAQDRVNWLGMITAAEAASRGNVVSYLRHMGFTGSSRAWGQASVPAEAEEQLQQIDFLSQYLALRRLHAELAQQGDSEALLGALVRGYANLGVLTDYFWSAAHKVYKARALLYAQRMVAHDPQSSIALQHRAYALALCGLQGLAEQDLQQAAKLLSAPPTTQPAGPPWVALLDCFCRYDWRRLQGEEWPKEARPLAAMLALASVETHAGSRLIIQAAQLLQERSPQCMRAYDSQCDQAGVGLAHKVTLSGPEALADMLAKRLRRIADLPTAVKEGLPEDPEEYRRATTRRELAVLFVEAAKDSSDTAEPSWAALGRMIEETNFTQIGRRLYFMSHQWSVPQQVAGFAASVWDAVEGHPYANYVRSYRYVGTDQRDLLDGLKAADATFAITPLLKHTDETGWSQRESIQELRSSMYNHRDQIEPDLVRLANDWNDPQQKMWYVRSLEQINPRSPFLVASRIQYTWDEVRDQWPRWLSDYSDQPAVARALVPKLIEMQHETEALQLLEHQEKVAPADWVFQQMADIYLKRGEEGMWLATLERRLKYPDYGLEHEWTQVTIARHFMSTGNFQRALPYAETAAESWAGWAMNDAAMCNEAVGNWERAELWHKRVSQRYDDSTADWYLWCLRTGYGDAEAAYELAEDDFENAVSGSGGTAVSAADLAWCHRMNDEPREALECFRRDFRQNSRFWSGLQAMFLANQLGDTALREELGRRVLEYAQRKWGVGRQIMDLMKPAWERGGSFDLAAYEKLIPQMNHGDQVAARAAVAEFLVDLGRAGEAEPYLVQVLREPNTELYGYRWAWAEARERGLDPVDLRGWPAPADRPAFEPPQTQPDEPSDAGSPTTRPSPKPAQPPKAPSGPPPAPI